MSQRLCFIAAVMAACIWASGCASTAPSLPDVQAAVSTITNAVSQAQQVISVASNAYASYQGLTSQAQQLGGAAPAAACADGACEVKAPPVTVPSARTAAVICGLTAVDPKRYGGWSGACPGCDVDAQAFAIACQSEGVPYELLLNGKATYIGIVASAKRAVASLKSGDLLILYISGHGGQVADPADPLEADCKSETLCLWDGPLSDNAVWQLLSQVPTGVRIWMITDTCNSGTNYRAPHDYTKAVAANGPTLLHWGGCADGKSSFGSAQGGTFTSAIVDSYKTGQSYAAWFKATRRRMPFTQRPTFESVGADFSALPAFR